MSVGADIFFGLVIGATILATGIILGCAQIADALKSRKD